MYQTIISSPLGSILAQADETAVTGLKFTEIVPENFTEHNNEILDLLKIELDEYFHSRRKIFSVPVNPAGTEFQKAVWNELMLIPFGKSVSYKEQSATMKKPLAIRAIASANGKNPVAILIPCHRVLGSDRSLTGYSGGLWRKEKLLKLEKIFISQNSFDFDQPAVTEK